MPLWHRESHREVEGATLRYLRSQFISQESAGRARVDRLTRRILLLAENPNFLPVPFVHVHIELLQKLQIFVVALAGVQAECADIDSALLQLLAYARRQHSQQ